MAGTQTILIVENDEATYRLYERALQTEYKVLAAAIEDDVLTLMRAEPVDAVVLEPGAVEGPGWALLANLKRSPDLSTIPIVICTVYDERRRGLELGSAAYLIKPVLPATLLATVRRFTQPASLVEAQHD